VTPPCDGERHYHDVTRHADLAVNEGQPAYCQCGSTALRVSRFKDRWSVTLLDGRPVLGTSADSLVSVAGAELVVGVPRQLSEA
jgi:hypothetical protein